MDIAKIALQFSGDIKWTHRIFDVRNGKFVLNTACCISIFRATGFPDALGPSNA